MIKRRSQVTHRAKSIIKKGCQVEVTARHHKLLIDEPAPLGQDTGMMPVELLLGALASCKSIVFEMTAKNLEIPYTHFEIEVEGDFDSAGFMGDPTVPIGFSALRTFYHIDTLAPKEDIETLITYVESHCPVAATIDDKPRSESILNYNSAENSKE